MEPHPAPAPPPPPEESLCAYARTLDSAQAILLRLPAVAGRLTDALAGPGGRDIDNWSQSIEAAIAAIPEAAWADLTIEERQLLHVAYIAVRHHGP